MAGIQRGSNLEFERNRTKIVDFSLNKRKRFRALRARGTQIKKIVLRILNVITNAIQRGITRPP